MLLKSLLQDFQLAGRALARRPLLCLVVILSMALVLGCNTAVLSYLGFLQWQRLPVKDPESLVQVTPQTQSGETENVSYPHYETLRERVAPGLSDLAAWSVFSTGVDTGERTVHAWGTLVSGNFFAILGVGARWGRLLGPEDDRPGSMPAVVLSHGFWQRHLGGKPDIVGKAMNVNGQPFTVAGILPEGFLSAGVPSEIYVPVAHAGLVRGAGPSLLSDSSRPWLRLLGRLGQGRTLAQAEAVLESVASGMRQEDPDLGLLHLRLAPGGRRVDAGTQDLLLPAAKKLLLFVGFLLLILCANVANSLLAGTIDRSPEMGVRGALGAGRLRLASPFLAEGLLLAFAGGAAGLVVAGWCMRLIERNLAAINSGVGQWAEGAFAIHMDLRVLSLMFLVMLGAGLLAGVFPAWHATTQSSFAALMRSGPAVAPPSRSGIQGGLVILQVALSLVLLAATGLFARGLWTVFNASPGFSADRLLLISLAPPSQGKEGRMLQKAAYEEIVEEVRSLPGIAASSLVEVAPLSGYLRSMKIAGPAGGQSLTVDSAVVGRDFFRTLEVPLLQGRAFAPGDTEDSPRVVIVNQAFAKVHWPGESPVGRRILLDEERGGAAEAEVVGLVADTHSVSLLESPKPLIYTPFAQSFRRLMTLVVRTNGPTAASLVAVRRLIEQRHRSFAVVDALPFREHLARSLAFQRVGVEVVAILGAVGLVLASLGVWSAMSFSVNRRLRDIGIRLALGAGRADVLSRVLLRAFGLIGAGTALGLAFLLASTRILASFLTGIETRPDLGMLGLAALLLLAIGIAASLQPALRASRVDPVHTLRHF